LHGGVIWHLFPRRYLAGQVRLVALVPVVTGCVVFALLSVWARMMREPVHLAVLVSLAAVFALVSAAAACFVASVRITRCAQLRFDDRFPHRAEIVDVVVRGRTRELSSDERVLATKYAVALRPYLAFQFAQLLCIAGSVVVSLASMAMVAPSPFLVGVAVGTLVVCAAVVALWVVEAGRVRRFIAANEHLLGASAR
jgi:hypothetical protein